ncbi:MAG: HemK2/MTQ2 family protein methyltransferase [Thermoplasmata archaeon]
MTRFARRAATNGPRGEAPVYPAREDTFLLLPFARSVRPGERLLEIGTGNGLLALEAARWGARVVATDRNPLALDALLRRARAEHLSLAAVRTDLARGLGRFDRILANPPYLPTRPSERDPDRWENLALDGGPDGCRTTARLVRTFRSHLEGSGTAYLLTSSRQAPTRLRAIRDRWIVGGGTVSSVARRDLEGERLEVWALAPPRRARG